MFYKFYEIINFSLRPSQKLLFNLDYQFIEN